MASGFSVSSTAEGATEVVAVLIAITNLNARVLTVENGNILPYGPLSPVHSSLQAGVRQWVKNQTMQPMGYVEQLYTFVDTLRTRASGQPVLYVSYLGLVKEADERLLQVNASWHDWYRYFPWEDHREGRPEWIARVFYPHLRKWVAFAEDDAVRQSRQRRVDLCWGQGEHAWIEDNTLYRYELLYEVGLIPESPLFDGAIPESMTGKAMQHNHRRVLAMAMSRLRAKIRYRPVISELMATEFTLLQLQKSIESLAGVELHKQNFRRLMQHQDLLEPTGQSTVQERGRPAQLYRFKDTVLLESLLSGSKLPINK
ncbi:NUDIX hydrolase [Advenella incenata]|jgi:hypothetical protein|uniref:NUDIX hydrolase n=1 Tax=Advenella incenata TaxID=267800 RepID=UPI000FEC2ABB|nr:hypothetical protein [Advenella incenata]